MFCTLLFVSCKGQLRSADAAPRSPEKFPALLVPRCHSWANLGPCPHQLGTSCSSALVSHGVFHTSL